MLLRRSFWLALTCSCLIPLYLLAAVPLNPDKISPEPVPGKLPPPPENPRGGVVYRLDPIRACPEQVFRLPVQFAEGDVADWGHDVIGVPDAWKVSTGKGVKVAVLDTGCDHGHRDLTDQIVAAKDFTGGRSGPSDVHGHGTHCSGIILAAANGTGMVGVAPDAKLIVAKVLSDNGSGVDTWIAAGIDWAVEQGADVISMSLGGAQPDPVTEAAIKRAVKKGVIVVCAAGNDGPGRDTVGYPAAYPECVAVAAVDSDSKVAGFSSRGPEVFIAAPGVNVRSCYPGDRFASMSGTSMATPYVSGCAALYVSWCKAAGKKPSPEDFKARLRASALDLPPNGRDDASGFGLVRPAKLFDKDTAPPPHDPPGDSIEIVLPGMTINGRPVKRIVIELEPKQPAKQ